MHIFYQFSIPYSHSHILSFRLSRILIIFVILLGFLVAFGVFDDMIPFLSVLSSITVSLFQSCPLIIVIAELAFLHQRPGCQWAKPLWSAKFFDFFHISPYIHYLASFSAARDIFNHSSQVHLINFSWRLQKSFMVLCTGQYFHVANNIISLSHLTHSLSIFFPFCSLLCYCERSGRSFTSDEKDSLLEKE